VFEELENVKRQNILKRQITSNTIMIEQNNVNNYIILSNNDEKNDDVFYLRCFNRENG